MPNNFLITLIKAVFGGSSKSLEFNGRLNLDQGAKEFIKKFEAILTDFDFKGKIIFDLTEVDFIYPSTILFFISLQETLEPRSVALEIRLSEGSRVHEYLKYCGFGNYFSIPTTVPDSQNLNPRDVFEMRSGQALSNTQKMAESVVDWLKQRQPMSLKVESDVIDSIEELLNNIGQHSHFSKYYLLGQAYPNTNRVRLVVYDNGVGIKTHITQHNFDQTHPRFRELISETMFNEMKSYPANTAIEQAARYEVSGTNYTKNSGAGLAFLINDLSPPTKGIVSILSEDGYVKWESGSVVESFPLPFKARGTLVSITIDCHADSILQYQEEG